MKQIPHLRKNKKKEHTSSARFIRGIIGSDPIVNDPRPTIVFAGRSNVGKSSTLNALLDTRLARISAVPGKTQEINFYLVADRMYFVDLPGYGYAKLPDFEAEKIRRRIIWYVTGGEARITLLIVVLDAKVGVTDYDRELIALAQEMNHPLLLVINKIDRLNQRERAKAVAKLHQAFPNIPAIPFSARTGEGKEAVLAAITKWSHK